MKKFNGRNVFGQKCIAKFVKLEKETAAEQYLAILADIENANGKKIEYTVDGSCFTKEEAKKFAKAASKFGSDEYMQLQEARKDYPSYKVVIISRKPTIKTDSYKGLTYEYMESYIKTHDDSDKSIMAEYEMLRGLSQEAQELLTEPCSYIKMKSWFLNKFPAIAEFHKKREELLSA